MRLAVLVSGSGTILEAILAEGIDVSLVLSDRPCRGLEVAEEAGVAAVLVDRGRFGGFSASFDRAGFTDAVRDELVDHGIDLVAMAGFGTVFSGSLYEAFAGRILNTHPALLPAFPGWHGVEDALAAGARETGCTVHLATEEMDAGPILAQVAVQVGDEDTAETLHERIKQVERRLYPACIAAAAAALAEGRSIESIAGELPQLGSKEAGS
jgi:phosphoribosylglycinamide formyltransferase 1